MQSSFEVFDICKAMATIGNPNSISDAGVGALCARAAVIGAYLNVKINAASYKDKTFVDKIIAEAENIVAKAKEYEHEILDIINHIIK
jgi:glutamate formiminotransferase/formiminotetrahydrofolate cyclodeaminase